MTSIGLIALADAYRGYCGPFRDIAQIKDSEVTILHILSELYCP
jgi:hypothetical protein